MPIKDRLIQLVKQEIREEETWIAGLPPQALTQPGAPDHWAVRDLLAHIAAWKENMVRWWQPSASEQINPWNEDADTANARIFEQHRKDTPEQVTSWLRQVNQDFVEMLQSLQEDELTGTARNPWNNSRPAWTTLAGNAITHPLSHMAQQSFERGEPQVGIRLFETAGDMLLALDDSPRSRSTAIYNMACAYAMGGFPDKAIANLREALKQNPDLIAWSKEDPDLTPLRGLSDYQALYS